MLLLRMGARFALLILSAGWWPAVAAASTWAIFRNFSRQEFSVSGGANNHLLPPPADFFLEKKIIEKVKMGP